MPKEEDLVIGEEESTISELDIIDNQLIVIGSMLDIDTSLHPYIEIEIKMVLDYAFKVIVKAQKKVLKDI